MVQAALPGQGVVLARLPLIAESLASADLVEPLPQMRLDSPMGYWLVSGQRSAARPEVLAFCEWLKAQAALTRQAIGDWRLAMCLTRIRGMVWIECGANSFHRRGAENAEKDEVENYEILDSSAPLCALCASAVNAPAFSRPATPPRCH